MLTATYSPEDDKLRLYSDTRLDAETYSRVKGAGFSWAPKQELFFAVWSPEREDLLLELAGEIDDETTSVADRAAERAERFGKYSEARLRDADAAENRFHALSDGIPLSQPILVGHHSEKRARKQAEKIQSAAEKAHSMLRTSQYWTSRARGVLASADYKAQPSVRARRIKRLEADKRKWERTTAEANLARTAWTNAGPNISLEIACAIANHDYISRSFPTSEFPRTKLSASTYEGPMSLWSALKDEIVSPAWAREYALEVKSEIIDNASRWIDHLTGRIEYEKVLLEGQGGDVAEKYDFAAGGRVLVGGTWYTISRINKSGGRVQSLSTNRRYGRVVGVESVSDYKPPTEEASKAVASANKLPPICNFDSPDAQKMTFAEWKKKSRWSDFTAVVRVDATETTGAYRRRRIPLPGWKSAPAFITDLKVTEPPKVSADTAPKIPAPEPAVVAKKRAPIADPIADRINRLKSVEVVTVTSPDLFPTPQEIVDLMIQESGLRKGQTVLEPSCGTGNIVVAALKAGGIVTGIEISGEVAAHCSRRAREAGFDGADYIIHTGDFLTFVDRADLESRDEQYDVVLMNPPFSKAQDIAHIKHALKCVRKGGVLVALCASGPRQQRELGSCIWRNLPDGSFKQSGTMVRVAMVTIRK